MKRILLVEDNIDTQILVKYLLYGYEVESANNCAEAIEKIKHNHYSLIITDIKLPDRTGTYLAEKIREHTKSPIAFLSNYDLSTVKEAAGHLDASYWLKSEALANNKLPEMVMETL